MAVRSAKNWVRLTLVVLVCQDTLTAEDKISWEVPAEWMRGAPTTTTKSTTTTAPRATITPRVPTAPSWGLELQEMVEEWRKAKATRNKKTASTTTMPITTSSPATKQAGPLKGPPPKAALVPTDTENNFTKSALNASESVLLVAGVSALLGLCCATCVAAGLSARGLRLMRRAVDKMNEGKRSSPYENIPMSSLTGTLRPRPNSAGPVYRRPTPAVSRPMSTLNTFSEVDLREDEIAILPAPCEAV